MQLLMAGVFGAASASAAAPESGSVFSDRIVICTPSGLKAVILNDNGTVPADTLGGSENCVWCLFYGNQPPLTGSSAELKMPTRLVTGYLCDPTNEIHKGQTVSNSFDSRAPPL